MEPAIANHPEGALLPLRVRPKAGRNAIGDVHEGRLRIYVSAAPEKGRANAATVRLLAKMLGRPTGSLEVIKGQSGRDKVVLCRGMTPAELSSLLVKETKKPPGDGYNLERE